jgi:AraC-like DNA-binding protein
VPGRCRRVLARAAVAVLWPDAPGAGAGGRGGEAVAVGSPEPVPVERAELATGDPDLTEELIRRRYVGHRPRLLDPAGTFGFRSRSSAAGAVTLDRLEFATAMSYRTDPFTTVAVLHLRAGQMDVTCGHRHCRAAAGDSVLFPPGAPLDILLTGMDYEVVQLPVEELAGAAARRGADPARIRFDAIAPASPAANRLWAATVRDLQRCFAGPDPAAAHPLLLAGAVQAAASAVLDTFPNSVTSAPPGTGPGRVDPAVVRRAVAHIDAHADEPIAVEHVAAAVGIGVRGLRAGFARHRGTTPEAYLRRVRLERAHRDLRAADATDSADPTDSAVAAIARRWGFPEPHRFAAEYREVYGRPPGRTPPR